MPRFIESICFKEKKYQLLDFHQQRVNETFAKYFPNSQPITLLDILPNLDFEEKYKVRVVYDEDSADVEFSEYSPKKITSLNLVDGKGISYKFKNENRSKIMSLYNQKADADDIIITRNNLITDSSYSNLAFRKENIWYTPKSYLLNGVKRQYLTKIGFLREAQIRITDLDQYDTVCFINAMLSPEEVSIPTSSILIK